MQLEHRIRESDANPIEGGTYSANNDSLGNVACDNKSADQHLLAREDLHSR